MARNDHEAGLKMLEELTINAHQIQEKLLEDILKGNAATEYLRSFLNGQTDKQLFKKNVPIVTYEDIKHFIDRIANGEPSQILVSGPITEFFQSSGTSGGKPKLIPSTAENLEKQLLLLYLVESVLTEHIAGINQGKAMYLLFLKQETETPCGLMARTVSTSFFKSSIFKEKASNLITSPMDTILCTEIRQSIYCQLLTGLLQRDKVVRVGSTFASTLLRGIRFLEDYWKELCSNIRKGEISNWITDQGCRNGVASVLSEPNPELADSIECLCDGKSWQGIIKKLWPKAIYIDTIVTGSMSQYIETLDFYSGGLPLVSRNYICSEAICGINLKPLSNPSKVSYTFLPNMAYFEFLPVSKNSGETALKVQVIGVSDQESGDKKNMNEDIEPVELVDVKLGECYELVVTTCAGLYRCRVGDILMVTGFHNNAPQFQFLERRNVVLSIGFDKTSEADLFNAVTKAKIPLDRLAILLTGYTSYADTSLTPGRYVLFWELKMKGSNGLPELDAKIMEQCCFAVEESLDFTYRLGRKEDAIAPLEIRVVKHGTFDALMDYYVAQGASITQYKPPSCIKSKEALKILDSNVIGRFFSKKTPL